MRRGFEWFWVGFSVASGFWGLGFALFEFYTRMPEFHHRVAFWFLGSETGLASLLTCMVALKGRNQKRE